MDMAKVASNKEIAPFRSKMALKLGGLLPNDGNINFTVDKLEDRSLYSNYLKFSINNDESVFFVQNQIVRKWSSRGTPFAQWPTTFHGLQVKGQKIKSPDEFTVKNELNKVYGNGQTVQVIKASDLDAEGKVKVKKNFVYAYVWVKFPSGERQFTAVAEQGTQHGTPEAITAALQDFLFRKYGEKIKSYFPKITAKTIPQDHMKVFFERGSYNNALKGGVSYIMR
jgi:hypothetical protein